MWHVMKMLNSLWWVQNVCVFVCDINFQWNQNAVVKYPFAVFNYRLHIIATLNAKYISQQTVKGNLFFYVGAIDMKYFNDGMEMGAAAAKKTRKIQKSKATKQINISMLFHM